MRLDPDDWRTAYLVTDGNSEVWQVVHAGLPNETWTNITGNLKEVYPLPINPYLFSVMMVKIGSTKVLLVGNQYGVYRTFNPQAGAPDALWTRYGNNLPFVQARDLLYDAKDDVFAIGTFGRGAWTVANASATIATPWSPTATLTNGGPVDEGSPGLVRFTDPSDPSPVDTAAGFRYSYDFDNDGDFEITDSRSASAVVPASYFADGPGIRTVRARIADRDGGYTDYTTTILITSVPPTVNVGPNAMITQGGSLSRPGLSATPAPTPGRRRLTMETARAASPWS